jgi:hypothetical protein
MQGSPIPREGKKLTVVGTVAPIYHPVGTVQELVDEGLDPAQFQTCHEPNDALGIVGCPLWEFCRMPYKGDSGPRNHPVLLISASGSSNQEKLACFQYLTRAPEHWSSGEVFEIMGNEGDEYETKEGTIVHPPPGSKEPAYERIDLVKKICDPFPRPFENPDLRQALLHKKITESVADRHAVERRERALEALQQLQALRAGANFKPNMIPGKLKPLRRPGDPSTSVPRGKRGTAGEEGGGDAGDA